ncbi:hypothetical protein [Parapedobacter tibetensis]|uniref:hypothetical protein n=1 Tax=Parapedobacter tibetensis TaxID=2972951 RepID=UPI00214DDFDA|nr:hypothetical protein [Parapedobacter tibetensis]
MIEKILFNKDGLHNRITRQIRLLPFTLRETKEFFHYKRVKLNDYQIAELYMTIGGIPHYLDLIRSGKSATHNIDDLCFSPQGMLRK